MIAFIIKKIKKNPFLFAAIFSIIFVHFLHEVSYLKKKIIYWKIV